ncbi:MAG: hypothetical protein D6714_19730 [Bacteroidetes bacterium]|nr:MAG: hypothetical protein D6714_19730 [Bacteroidota bacterium]
MTLWGQQRDRINKEKIEAFRVDFYTRQMQLTPEESDKFWPLYREMQKERTELRKAYKPDNRIELMSDAELEQNLENRFLLEEKQVALQRKYFEKFKTILPLRKVAMLYVTEQKFKKQLLERARGNRSGEGPRQRGQGNRGFK